MEIPSEEKSGNLHANLVYPKVIFCQEHENIGVL
jgi:hypothetical protein